MSTDTVKAEALKHFDIVGFAGVSTPSTIDFYKNWLERGFHGEMEYLSRHFAKKKNPELLLPNAKSWIVCGLKYDTKEQLSVELGKKGYGWIARYARGPDYHDVIREKQRQLISVLQMQFLEAKFFACVDTGAVLERELAHNAGLGWIGKNGCLINKDQGSFIFISEILTTLELAPDKPVFDHCGTCSRCIDACPTQALLEPRLLDARKCISYWTIESKTPAPEKISGKFGGNFFGCDICQDVCPWNQHSRKKDDLESAKESGLVDLRALLNLSDDEIKRRTKGTALSRAKPKRLKENATIVLKNQNSL